MLEVARLSTNADGGIKVERELVLVFAAPTLGLDEAVQPRNVFQLRICVEEKSCMFRVRQAKLMQILQIGDKVVDSLRIEKLHG